MNLAIELESIFSELVSTQEHDNHLQQNTIANAAAINALVQNATAIAAQSAIARATAVCKISQLIFGIRHAQVVTSTDQGYVEEEQVNW
jgi:hypothetical protein